MSDGPRAWAPVSHATDGQDKTHQFWARKVLASQAGRAAVADPAGCVTDGSTSTPGVRTGAYSNANNAPGNDAADTGFACKAITWPGKAAVNGESVYADGGSIDSNKNSDNYLGESSTMVFPFTQSTGFLDKCDDPGDGTGDGAVCAGGRYLRVFRVYVTSTEQDGATTRNSVKLADVSFLTAFPNAVYDGQAGSAGLGTDGVTYAKVAPATVCAANRGLDGGLCPSTAAVFSECSTTEGATTTTAGTTFAECASLCTGARQRDLGAGADRAPTCFAFNYVMAEDPAASTCELISDTTPCTDTDTPTGCEMGPSRQDITVAPATGLKVCYVNQEPQ